MCNQQNSDIGIWYVLYNTFMYDAETQCVWGISFCQSPLSGGGAFSDSLFKVGWEKGWLDSIHLFILYSTSVVNNYSRSDETAFVPLLYNVLYSKVNLILFAGRVQLNACYKMYFLPNYIQELLTLAPVTHLICNMISCMIISLETCNRTHSHVSKPKLT